MKEQKLLVILRLKNNGNISMKSGKDRKAERSITKRLSRNLMLWAIGDEVSMPFWSQFTESKHKKRKIERDRNTTRKPVSGCLSEGTGKGMPKGTDEINSSSDTGDECPIPRYGNRIKIKKEDV
ncbi:hypothetical protein LCGC14_1599510 [marine sediment metagenome]|uniref:Uncharacterized protein n=1 Tax=marine sediment metagenome TaxID=412755 RepID=A0A0F9IBJ8_9ZZZZ